MTEYDSGKVAKIHQHLHSQLPAESALRVKALETLLVDRGLGSTATIDAWVEAYSEKIEPKRGAHVVAKAWIARKFTTNALLVHWSNCLMNRAELIGRKWCALVKTGNRPTCPPPWGACSPEKAQFLNFGNPHLVKVNLV
jgi:hypothetical protein